MDHVRLRRATHAQAEQRDLIAVGQLPDGDLSAESRSAGVTRQPSEPATQGLSWMLIFAPAASVLPGFGLWLLTLPVFEVAPLVFLTLPVLQSAALIFFFAAFSLLPPSFGTTQWAAGAGGSVDASAGGGVGVVGVTAGMGNQRPTFHRARRAIRLHHRRE